MIKIKLEFNKSKNIIFKIKIDESESKKVIFRRALMEGKKLKNNRFFNYEVPLRFFVPICNNIDKSEITLDKRSILSYYEFSDFYDENYYYEVQANAKYMKKWREEGCPNIYKICIDENTCEVKKEIAFKKPTLSLGKLNL